jgi:predicted permease
LRWFRRRREREAEWRDEIESHLAMRADWHRAGGLPSEEAERAAGRRFGSRLAALEALRAVHISPWVEAFMQDVRLALRGFRRSPAVALVAIATMAIGIGASTAVFSVVDPLLFRRLPYPHDAQLVSLGYLGPVDDNEFNVVSSYLDWRRQQTAFQAITSMRPNSACDLLAGDTPRRLSCYYVEANFLRTFGSVPAIGRDFTIEDDQPHAPTVVLLSYALWRSAYGGNAKILGQTTVLDEERVRVVGVLPHDFQMPQLGDADILIPERLDAGRPRSANSSSFLRTFARLRDGVSIAQARASLWPLFEDCLAKDVPPQLRSEVRLVVRSLRDRRIHDVKAASWMLFGSVLALLLVACANVANLLLARAAARRRELAMRAAIGAGRGRLIRQTLTESLVLGFAGGAAGCATAWLLLRVFVRLAPNGLPRLEQARIDMRVLLFALAASTAAAVLFGMAPALQRPRAEFLAGWHTAGATRTLFRKVLISAQIAISLLLLTGASLFLRSLWKLENQPLGYQPARLVTASFTLRPQRYRAPQAQAAFFTELERRLRNLPGVASFALSDSIPPRGSMGRPYSNIVIAGHPPVAENGGMVEFRWVTPLYFQTMGIAILSGRDFTGEDRTLTDSPVILSATLARRMFGDENPVGQLICLEADDHWQQIVGVAADVKNAGLTAPADPEYYRLRINASTQFSRDGVALFRTSAFSGASVAPLAQFIRHEFAALDPTLPVNIETMETRVDRFRDRPRFLAFLVSLFAALGLVLAAVGLYGVLSFLVAQQTRQIGVRMALGARPRDIALQMQKHAGVWTAAGVAAGLAGSLALAKIVRGLLFEVSPADPLSFAVAVAVLVAVAALAAWLPSHRASRVDPVIALRHD